jgi:hypothetical protein
MRQTDLRSKDACSGMTQLYRTLISALSIGVSCVGALSVAGATDFYLPAALMDGQTPHDTEFEACLTSAIAAGGSCILPEGTLMISRYPSPLRQEVADNGTVLDLHGATLRGQGPTTIIKGISASGFDVLQLNGVANFNIRDLAITTCVTGEDTTNPPTEDPPCLMEGFGASGVNGISMTNGTSNIRIYNVHIYDLPFVPHPEALGPYTDGGKAFTVQCHHEYNEDVQMRDIYVEHSSSRNVFAGFWMDCNTNTNAEPDNINVIFNTFEGYLAGIVFSFPASPPMAIFGAAILDNAVRGGQFGIVLGRGRAYYVKGNYVVLRDDLYIGPDPGSGLSTRQPLRFSEVENVTVELNTFEMNGGNCFVGAIDAIPYHHRFRFNNFYGAPPSRLCILWNPDFDFSAPSYEGFEPWEFPAYFDATGTFH